MARLTTTSRQSIIPSPSTTLATATTTITLDTPSASNHHHHHHQHQHQHQHQQHPVTDSLLLKLKRPKKKVSWKEGTVDNEFMNKKSSKKCCIFHKEKPFDDDDSDAECECDHNHHDD